MDGYGDDDREEDGASESSAAPQEYSNVEYSKSFSIQELNGLMVMLMGQLGPSKSGGGRSGAAHAAVQLMIQQKGYATVYILSDDRSPSIRAVLRPGQAGHELQMTLGHQVSKSTEVEVEASLVPGALNESTATVKHKGDDYTSSLTATSGQQGKQVSLTYHQAINPSGTLTLGGSVTAIMDRLLPLPVVAPKGEGPSVTPVFFGSYTHTPSLASSGSAAVVGGNEMWMGSVSGSDLSGSLRYWKQATKDIELGANLTASLATGHSTCGVGMRMNLAKSQGQLTATANSDSKVQICYQQGMHDPFFGTGDMMFTILSATFDHKQQHHSVGAQLQFQY